MGGLLKWSLSYTDGTQPTNPDDVQQLSAEDKAFLESVMKEGIIDENERMKEILKQVTEKVELWTKMNEKYNESDEELVEDLLQELRDIVEQIDYARAFAAMKGLPFLLGCVSERVRIPRTTRLMCLGIVATMSQHNPPIQKELLELGAIKTLSDIYFEEYEERNVTDVNGQIRAKIIQAISANVRSHELAENVFCQLQQSVQLIEYGLGTSTTTTTTTTPEVLQKRTLFFLNALVTSDTSTRERVRLFNTCTSWIASRMLQQTENENEGTAPEVREMALALLRQILEQKKSVNAILQHKDLLAGIGVQRIAYLRTLTGEDAEFATVELEHWEALLLLLARAEPDIEEEENTNTTTLLLGNGPIEPPQEVIPQ